MKNTKWLTIGVKKQKEFFSRKRCITDIKNTIGLGTNKITKIYISLLMAQGLLVKSQMVSPYTRDYKMVDGYFWVID